MGFFDFLKKKKEAEPEFPQSAFAAAPISGKVVSMRSIPDPVFSGGAMGWCCGIEPEGGTVTVQSPLTGEIMQVAATHHALGVSGDNGVQIIIHVGIDTVGLKGDGFQCCVREGQPVKQGDPLLIVDVDKIHAAGLSAVVISAVLNTDDFKSVTLSPVGSVTEGSELMKLTR